MFADDTSLFSTIHDVKKTAYELNKDLQKKDLLNGHIIGKCHLIQTWISKLRKLFFQGKWLNDLTHQFFFSDIPVSCVSFQKHLGIYPDEKLNFNHHIKEKMTKTMKGIGVIKRLSKTLSRHSLLTIYKSFVRPHLDFYGDTL